MDRMIYTAMSGANSMLNRQSILANNLANVSTNGFREELSSFRAVPLKGDGSPTRVMAMETTTGYSYKPGTISRTGRNLDAMAQGQAWFAVQGLDGTEGYTRNGSFEINSAGTLVTNTGLTVLSAGGAPIDIPANAEVSMGSDGTISAKVQGQPSSAIGRLKLATPTDADPLVRGVDGLFRATSNQPMPQDATALIQTGALEGSNVSAIESMVGMIALGRQFDGSMRLLQNAEANDKAATQLLGSN